MKVRFCGATIKGVEQGLRAGLRDGDVRVVRRALALLELGQGRPVLEVAEQLGMGVSTMHRWLHDFLLGGMASLRYGRPPGRPAKLSPDQKRRLAALLDAGPLAAGYPTGCWSATLVQDLIHREFGHLYSMHYLSAFLRNMGYSYQKARFVSDHLDPERRRAWREREWPTILQQARARGALLLFGDEASFAQWGSISYTWARRGEQPVVQTCGKRKAAKVFGLIDYGTGALFFRQQTERFTAASYCSFLEEVLAQTDRPIILLQDGARYHTAAATRAFIERQGGRLTVHQLPSYSPDYNPIEHLWKNMKRRATHNRYFPSFEALQDAVASALTYFQQHPEAVKQAIGATLHHLGDLPLAA